jgi:hypothetical protein
VAQTKKKRRRKHRGTQGGRIDSKRRTGRPQSREEAKARARSRRKSTPKEDAPPTWRTGILRALVSAVIFFVLIQLFFKRPTGSALVLSVILFVLYIPISYYIDTMMWRKRERARIRASEERK